MTVEIISNKYQNGRRTEVQEVTYTKSEDLFMLANLQRQFEDITERIENAAEGENVERWRTEQTRLVAELTKYQAIVDGYTEVK